MVLRTLEKSFRFYIKKKLSRIFKRNFQKNLKIEKKFIRKFQ